MNPEFRPFCSRRCADLDLHRWLSGSYAIPVTESDERPEDGAPGEGDGMNAADEASNDIAIVGMAGRFPGARLQPPR